MGLSVVHKHLLGWTPPDSLVLELGPASGYMTRALVERRCTVDAIEQNPADAALTAQHGRKVVLGSADDPASYQGMDAYYDVVMMADVLEHMPNPEVALRQVAARLRPGGVVLVSLPNIAFWRMRLALLAGRFDYQDTGLLDRTHLRFFTLASARKLFATSGFAILEVDTPAPTNKRLRRTKHALKRFRPSLLALNLLFRLQLADPFANSKGPTIA